MYITNFFGETLTIPQLLEQTFAYSYVLLGPIVAILIGYSVLFSAISIFALYRLNFQNR